MTVPMPAGRHHRIATPAVPGRRTAPTGRRGQVNNTLRPVTRDDASAAVGVDVGSTWTKAVLVRSDGALAGFAEQGRRLVQSDVQVGGVLGDEPGRCRDGGRRQHRREAHRGHMVKQNTAQWRAGRGPL